MENRTKRKFFKWEIKPNGNCPVQAYGWFLNHYFYFRARGSRATIEFYNDKGDFYISEPTANFVLKETPEYVSGWLSKRTCKFLIFKGCFKFLISSTKQNRFFNSLL